MKVIAVVNSEREQDMAAISLQINKKTSKYATSGPGTNVRRRKSKVKTVGSRKLARTNGTAQIRALRLMFALTAFNCYA